MSLRSMYHEIKRDHFPPQIEISFIDGNGRQTLSYEKVEWDIEGERRGLRYGENPDQEAAMYRLINGNLNLGGVESILPGRYLMSDVELLQSGKHPGKINITDIDSALNILRYFQGKPCCAIVKHNNPSGVALGADACDAYLKAYWADRIAAFGGAVALNLTVDMPTAEAISESYCEVVAAPDFADGVLALFSKKKNLRVMKVAAMDRLAEWAGKRVVDYKSLIDGGLILQWSYDPVARSFTDLFPAESEYQGTKYTVNRLPTRAEGDDMVFGWLVEAGVTSNSVLFVKNGITVGIGTGEQDRVGVAEIARDKAYKKTADLVAWKKWKTPLSQLTDQSRIDEAWNEARAMRGGLTGSIMVSDAFFPFRDGIDVGLKEGVTAVVQPGGSIRDWEVIEACNQYGATMMFTGQRSFRH